VSRAVLSLGSNLGDPRAQLEQAVHRLGAAVRVVSPLFRSPPWGPVPQDDFLNLVLVAEDEHRDALGWLQACRDLEAAAGRTREVRWGPRTLDADVVAVQDGGRDVVLDTPELTVPHPRAAERAFVLLPWSRIDPFAVLPGAGAIAELLEGLDTDGIVEVGRVH
jgi:2-amino-4-hydroxy-6-hydroxymethyldihydropteridine diphosphokinase